MTRRIRVASRLARDAALPCHWRQVRAEELRLCSKMAGGWRQVRAEELRFREEGVKDVVRDVLLPWCA